MKPPGGTGRKGPPGGNSAAESGGARAATPIRKTPEPAGRSCRDKLDMSADLGTESFAGSAYALFPSASRRHTLAAKVANWGDRRMLRGKRLSRLMLPLLVALHAATALAVGEARSEVANWKIVTKKDELTEQELRFAATTPKSNPMQHGKSVTTILTLRCVTIFLNRPTQPELMILFTSLTGMWHVKNFHTRYRFDEGPVRDYKLSVAGRGGAHAIALPKFPNQDPVADLVAAKRLRVEVTLPSGGPTLLDFNVTGAADAVRAISCH